MVILFFVMLILQPQNAKGADVLTAGNLAAILQYADGAATANSTLLSTNTTDPSTVIVLSSFTAVPSETKINTIDINWVTSSEIDTAGFNIYRDEAENGQYTTQLNPELIPSTGSSTNGVSYNFEDAPVATGKIYYYMLEAIDLNGYKKMYGPASANWPCQTDADCGNGLFCDKDTNQCISNSSSTSTTISATTSIITTSTISPVTTSTTTISSTSTTISATTSIITTSTISPVTTSDYSFTSKHYYQCDHLDNHHVNNISGHNPDYYNFTNKHYNHCAAFNYNYRTNNNFYNTIRPVCCGGNLWGKLRGNRTAEEISG